MTSYKLSTTIVTSLLTQKYTKYAVSQKNLRTTSGLRSGHACFAQIAVTNVYGLSHGPLYVHSSMVSAI